MSTDGPMTMNPNGRQAGFSLVELMIAAVIGLVLLGGVISISINSSRTQRELEQIGRQIENGRYAVAILEEALSHAGYYGEYYNLGALPGTLPNPCSTTPGTAIPLPIQGLNNISGGTGLTCLPDSEHRDGTDIVVIRRASTSPTAIGSLTANELYLQTRAADHVLAQADGSETAGSPGSFALDKRDGSTANIRKFHVEIYFIGPDETVDELPTLKRKVLNASGGSLAWQEEALVDGIEHFEVEYGIDTSGDGSPDSYMTGPGLTQFADTVTLKVHLVARSIDTFAGHSDDKSYDLGGDSAGPFNDAYRRRAYSTTIRAVNIAIRRE